jgi:hypothetical protein
MPPPFGWEVGVRGREETLQGVVWLGVSRWSSYVRKMRRLELLMI